MKTIVRSFNGTEAYEADCARPDRYRTLFSELRAPETAVIARGSGLNYAALSAGNGVRSVLTESFDRILAFDGAAGTVTVECGMRLGPLLAFLHRRGWTLPVVPGHPDITVGGCLAVDVHGKNHLREGTFRRCVEELVLFHPDHGELRCSERENRDVFVLSLGGAGLTGFLISARLRLKRPAGLSFELHRRQVASLGEAVDQMQSLADSAESLYSWHDLNGSPFGRGFVYAVVARPEAAAAQPPLEGRPRSRRLLRRWPWPVLSGARARLATGLHFRRELRSPASRAIRAEEAAFPIVDKEFYFGLFGPRGFHEYQLIVPKARWPAVEQRLPRLIRDAGAPVTLASLKLFAGQRRALSFDGEGVCLALDAPESPAARKLWSELDALMIAEGGIVNVYRDSRLDARTVRRLFADYDGFKSSLERFDPKRRFDSSWRRRLEL